MTTEQSKAAEITALTMRTDYCGELRETDIGRSVTVCGWVAKRREHGEHLAFVDLRDHTGVIQVVVDHAHDLRSEFVLAVTGSVRKRPNDTANIDLATGEIEIGEATVEVLATASAPPFPVEAAAESTAGSGRDIDETLRIRHRYLDLRSSRMQRNLRQRSKINSAIRRAMDDQGFIEIETPILMASTPEGARDFVVPSRLRQGSFYALPQSPQLFKQLCMVGGLDRYYQIARCLRDEDLRADRQFEFTQLDLEMSFADGEAVRVVVSNAVAAAVHSVGRSMDANEISEITWHEAMNRFGSDKPDMRYGMELTDVTEVFAKTEFNAFKTPCVKAIKVPGGADLSRNAVDQLTETAKSWGAKGLVWMRVTEAQDGDEGSDGLGITSPVAKFMSDAEISGVLKALDATQGDMCYLVADDWRKCCHVLGLLRQHFGASGNHIADGELNFVWVVDFPLFEEVNDHGDPVPAHHPFTMPIQDDLELLALASELRRAAKPLPEGIADIRSQAYDLVLNGWELGSGSVRISRGDVQQQVFDLLGIAPEVAQERFGFLLSAFTYGAPPHAGFAVGIDRLAAQLCGEESIREVIAFPKTQSGADPLTNAPSALGERQMAELGLRLLQPPQEPPQEDNPQ